jgi:TolB-like protein
MTGTRGGLSSAEIERFCARNRGVAVATRLSLFTVLCILGSFSSTSVAVAGQGGLSASGERVAGRRESVVVFPFTNVSNQASDEWVGEGIAETVVADLKSDGTLSVLGPEVVLETLRSRGASLVASEGMAIQLSRELKATWLVTGAYQRLGDQVRITARITDAQSGEVLHTAKIDGRLAEMFVLQDRIVTELGLGRRPTSPPKADLAVAPAPAPPVPVAAAAAPPAPAAAATAAPPPASPTRAAPVAQPAAAAAPAAAREGAAAQGVLRAPISPRTSTGESRVIVHAHRVAGQVRVDGRLDEEAYQQIPPFSDFYQQQPRVGEPSSERTETWVLYDDTNLYVACRCWQNPLRIIANDMRRDSRTLNSHDHFAVLLDSYQDARTGVLLSVTAAGGMRDALLSEGSVSVDWNPVYDARVSRFEGGWIAEFAIPFRMLRYGPGRQQNWGLLLRRRIAQNNETSFNTKISPSQQNLLADGTTLTDLEVPPATTNLEVKPYAISSLTSDFVSKEPFRDKLEGDGGVDVKVGVTKSLTADFTYNTDFAQVEADEAQVNLTRFNIVFPEKRDFFLEGQSIFDFGSPGGDSLGSGDAPSIFYSRQIGLAGARAIPVIGGARLTGKAGPWTIGGLSMETEDDETSGAKQTNFTVMRLRRDILRRSTIGGIFTERSISTVSTGANYLAGIDANFAFFQNIFLNGYIAKSRTEGKLGHDLNYRALFNYTADRYGLSFDRMVVEDNFNPEVGFLRRSAFRRNFARARFSPRTTNNRVVRQWTYQGSIEYITDNSNRLESREVSGLFRIAFQNSDSFQITARGLYESLTEPFTVSRQPTVIRIPEGGYRFDDVAIQYTGGLQRRLSGTASVEAGNYYSGRRKTVTYRGRVDVTSQFGIEPNISLNWIELPEGNFSTTVIGSRPTYTMTPRMFVSALIQYSSSSRSLSSNVRFRWEYQPGSELFVVYSEGRSTLPEHGTNLENRGLVVKINRLFAR